MYKCQNNLKKLGQFILKEYCNFYNELVIRLYKNRKNPNINHTVIIEIFYVYYNKYMVTIGL